MSASLSSFAKGAGLMPRLIVVGVVVAGIYALTAAKTPHHVPTMTNLPIDSLVKTLGPDVAKGGMGVSAGHNEAYVTGRFETTYTADFNAPAIDVVHTMAMKVRDVVMSRGGKLTGGTSSGDGFESLRFETDSATGWIGVIAAKPARDHFNRLMVIVTEQHRAK